MTRRRWLAAASLVGLMVIAMVTMGLDQSGLNILDARIFTSRHGYTLDTFIVLDTAGMAIRNSYRIQEIISTLKNQLKQKRIEPVRVARRVARQLKHFPISTQVNFSTDKYKRYTIAELITADRPGLLARVGQALVKCGVRVQNAKIATIGARVEDVFFITDSNNNPLTAESQYTALRDTIIKYVDSNEPG